MSNKTSRIYDCPLIELETDEDDLASATTTEIWYKKPKSGTTGIWEATVSGTKLRYQVEEDEADEYGPWILNTHYVIGGLEFTGRDFIWSVENVKTREV